MTTDFVRADKPVDNRLSLGQNIWYSVEEVNLDRDEYRWWCLVLTQDLQQAYAALAELKSMNPDHKYRLTLQVVLASD